MPVPQESAEISEFLEAIYADETGIVYLAFKPPGSQTQFRQEFYRWPEQESSIVERIISERSQFEVYFAPALFQKDSGQKQDVLGARVFWAEFDGKVPENLQGIPEPSIRILSSSTGHEHWYWRTETLNDVATLEKINRGLAYLLGADASGWDANQILRPINTLNHKREKTVTLISKNYHDTVTAAAFGELPEPPPIPEAPLPDKIPDVTATIAKYSFPKAVWSLFARKEVPVGSRSSSLMSLGYSLAEMKLTNEEILSLLLNADQRWGKFYGRTDQVKRLLEIVTLARLKYPLVHTDAPEEDDNKLIGFGFKSLMAQNVNLEWVWEGLLQTQGYMLMTGPSGVGKTQVSLDAASHMALGKDFLEYSVPKPRKIGFFSLEMGLADLKTFLELQMQGWTDDELHELEQNLLFFPLGEPLYLNKDIEKKKIEKAIEEYGLEGIFIDSLGSTTEGELSEEKDVKNLMDWNDRLRQRFDVFSWYIHHHRKATSENKKPNKLSDIYGSQYITARATTVLTLWDSGVPHTIDVLPLKVRLSKKPERFSLFRDGQLHFTKKVSGITIVSKSEQPEHEVGTDDTVEEEVQQEIIMDMALKKPKSTVNKTL